MSRLFASVLVALALVALSTGAVAAKQSTVTIDVSGDLGAGGGIFTADGDALCPAGTTTDVATVHSAGPVTTFRDLKTFTCADLSGTFTLSIVARVMDCAMNDYGTWRVVGGTGDYAGLRGHGLLVGTYYGGAGNHCDADGIDDHLTGKVKL